MSHAEEKPPANVTSSWPGRPASLLRVLAEAGVLLAVYFLVRFYLFPIYLFYKPALLCYRRDIIAPRWEWFKTFNTLFGYDEQGRHIKHYSPEWLNPAHIAVAREGYRIQSQVLGISDRWGFFDSHPSVHAQQGACAAVLFQLSVVVLVFFTVANCFVLSTSDANSRFRACLTLLLMWGFAQLWVTIMAWAHSHVIGMERRAGKLHQE